MRKILLVEDEEPIAESVAFLLRSEGFEVAIAQDGLEALNLFRSFSPNLVILDLMLPKLSGLDFCRIVRRESSVPIIMLTARTEEVDRIVGLEMGADDYVTKPFSIRELLARVRSILRRVDISQSAAQKNVCLTVGAIEMDISRRSVVVNGKPVHLPLKEFGLLRLLMSNPGKVMSRDELIRAVWDTETASDTGSLDVHVRWLREKIEKDPSHPKYIRTARGLGYAIIQAADDDY